MSQAFQLAHAFTARWEGGLSDHPADPGGLTNYGISLRWARELAAQARQECCLSLRDCAACPPEHRRDCGWPGLDIDMDGDVDADDIRACTRAQAARLFRQHFWDKLACARLPLPLAVTLYDGAVNMGAPRAVRQLQRAMNMTGEAELEEYSPISEDGRMGPGTQTLAKALADSGLDYFAARQSLRLRETFYRDLAARRPSMQAFLQGWRNRTRALGRYLAELQREEA
ncbi:MAG: hypothetical protein IJD16_08105 [Desulfovibrio sp.]|nr:hypothetical protein [Desulfovibrio sp.]